MGQTYSNLDNQRVETEERGRIESRLQSANNIDPRSPSQKINRTPIRFSPKYGSNDKYMYSNLDIMKNASDPRSPNEAIQMTPMRDMKGKGVESCEIAHKLFQNENEKDIDTDPREPLSTKN